jgi:hypothetical protein
VTARATALASPIETFAPDANDRLEELGFYRYDADHGRSAYVKMLGDDDPGRFVVVADATGRQAPDAECTPVLVAIYGDDLSASSVTEYATLEAFLRRLEN